MLLEDLRDMYRDDACGDQELIGSDPVTFYTHNFALMCLGRLKYLSCDLIHIQYLNKLRYNFEIFIVYILKDNVIKFFIIR